MKLAALLLFAAGLRAQTITIDAGSPSENACAGSKYGAAQQADMVNQAAPFNTLRYAPSFSCTIPAPIGTCQVTLQFFENRPAIATPAVPASGPGLRIFTASVNGVSTGPLDLFMLAGAQVPYGAPSITAPSVDGFLHVNLAALPGKGNAVLSGIQASCAPFAPPSTPPSGITGVECLSLVAANTNANQPAITLAVTLPDGTCLPVRMLTSAGMVGRIISVSGMSAANADNLSPSGAFTSGLIWLLVAPLSATDNSVPIGFPTAN